MAEILGSKLSFAGFLLPSTVLPFIGFIKSKGKPKEASRMFYDIFVFWMTVSFSI